MRLVTVMLIFCLPFVLFAQQARITIEAYSPYEIEEMGLTTEPTSGLPVVGVGEIVYLTGAETGGANIQSYAWSIISAPSGSAAALDSTTSWRTSFRPDLEGSYQIRLEITTDSGVAADTVTITAATYVGVGTLGGATPQFPQCGLCHANKVSEWEQTGHASMFSRGIDGLVSSHYAAFCIECHTVGYNTNATNNGFDDLANQYGWTFPDSLQVGNWDSMLVKYPEVAQMANIQCENCHGPGSQHMGDPSKIGETLDEGVCGRCHEEPPYHVKNLQWENSKHAEGVAFAAGWEECRSCHSGDGFIHAQDPEAYPEPLGFAQVTCQVCHDPHDATNMHQLRTVSAVTLFDSVSVFDYGPANLCAQCHRGRRNAELYAVEYHPHYGPHHSNQADMFLGKNAVFFGKTIDGRSTHNTALSEACVECHMSPTPAAGEPGHNYVGEHTFSMHYDGGTPDDPGDDVDNVAVCQNCHGPITSFESILAFSDYDQDGTREPFVDEVEGLLDELGMLLPPKGDPSVVVDTSQYDFTTLEFQAAFNYLFVEEDKSHGIHNPPFTIALLETTIDTLRKVTGIATPARPSLPVAFVLEQNYPNPFNPETRIRFGLPHAGEVVVTIYNILGQPVRTLFNGHLNAGYHTLTWDGTDDTGNPVSSGTYILTVKAGDKVQMKKMVLLR